MRVLGRRDDGYHELRTILQSIALFDTLTIRRARGPLRMTSSDAALQVDTRNLVWRAADAVWTASGRRGGARDVAIDLVKRIPVAAGLGGGSSDAAATLRALADMWRVDRARLHAIASALGADVPYFLEGGTVLGLERGDLLFPLIDAPKAWVVIVVPAFGVSTVEAYGWFDQDRGGGSSFDPSSASGSPRARSRGDKLRMSGHQPPLALSLSKGELRNDLQGPVAARHPEIPRIVSALKRAGASHAAMSGSGSAVFGLFPGQAQARRAAQTLATARRRIILTRTLTRGECGRLAAK